MKYEHTPRPEVEQHYHIQHLIETQEKRSDDRTYHRNKAKALEERNELLKDAKRLALTDFWCDTCRIDFKALAWKQTEIDWSNPNQMIGFYKTKCWHGHWCMRLITDKHKDGFFIKSRAIARDRGKYYNDIIQPGDTGYQLLYGKKNA